MADPSVFVDAVVSSERDLATCIEKLFDYCREHCPSPTWQELVHLDFQQDVLRVTEWLRSVLTSEAPGADIEALWFGLRSTPQERDLLYLAGSDYFDLEDHGWVRFPIYWPANRRADSPVLQQIHQVLRKAGGQVFSLGWYVLCLGYACLAVAEACKAIDPAILLGPREKRYVAVGFDGGDFVALGWVDRDGWHVFKATEQPPVKEAPAAEVRPAGPSLLQRAAAAMGRAMLALLRLLWRLMRDKVFPFLGRLALATGRALGRLLWKLGRTLIGYVLDRDLDAEELLSETPPAQAGTVPLAAASAPAADLAREEEAAAEVAAGMLSTPPEAPAMAGAGVAPSAAEAPEAAEPGLSTETQEAEAAVAAPQQQVQAEATVPEEIPSPAAEAAAQGPTEEAVAAQVAAPTPIPQFESIAAAMSAYAQEAVTMARKEFRVELDYSEASLEQVEWILTRIAGWRSSGLWRELLERLLGRELIDKAENLIARLEGREPPQVYIQHMSRIWGAYVGEVLRLRWNGTWAEEVPPPAETMIALRVQRHALFPIGRVQARLEGGPEQSIWFYYRALKQRFEGG
jgi:hypothetical protein